MLSLSKCVYYIIHCRGNSALQNGTIHFNYSNMCVIPEIALYHNGSCQPLLRASALSAPLREIILARRLRAGNFVAASPLQAPPSAVPAATSPSQVDREDLAYLASTDLGFPVGIPVTIAIPPKQVSLAM